MNILFVCNGNVARSQEAELFFNTLKHDKNASAVSGGINVKIGKPIDPLVVEVMQEIGYEISTTSRKFVDEVMARSADVVISFKPVEELPDYLKNRTDIAYWPVADPQHQPIEFHRQVRDEIKARVSGLIDELGDVKS